MAIFAVAAAIAVGVWGWKATSVTGKTAVVNSSAESAANDTRAVDAGPVAPSTATLTAPGRVASSDSLPSLRTPLRLSLPELERRALAGEPQAACRLAAELAYCEQLRVDLVRVEQAIEQEQAPRNLKFVGPEESAEMAARRMRWRGMSGHAGHLLREAAHCEGVAAAPPATIARHWRAAALAGHVPSMTHYAVGNAFRIRDTLANLPALAIYRREAELIAKRAAAAGDARAVAALAAAYSPLNDGGNRTYLAQVVRPDVLESLTLFLQLRAGAKTTADPRAAMIDEKIAQLARIATPEQLARGKSQSAKRPAVSLSGLSPHTLFGGGLADVPREQCDGDGLPGAAAASGLR